MSLFSHEPTYFQCKELSTSWAGVDVIISSDADYEEFTPELFTTTFTVSFDDCNFISDGNGSFNTNVAGWCGNTIENMGNTMEEYAHEPISHHRFLFRKIPVRTDLYQQYECE